jgi:hypothetical protein
MLKRMLVAAAVTGLIAGAAIPVQITPAMAGKSGCREAAKAKFGGGDLKARHAFKKECKAQWKAYKTVHGKKRGLFKKAAA